MPQEASRNLNYWICPSILSADFARLGQEAEAVMAAGADRLHIDVMDNHYVPNLTFGPLVLESLRRYGLNAKFDVHLMVQPVEDLVSRFIDAGADLIVFHPKAAMHPGELLASIKNHQNLKNHKKVECGLALNPDEPLSLIEPYLGQIDRLLIMSVFPGFGGQKFMPEVLEKVRAIAHIRAQKHYSFRIEMDGGISPLTLKACQDAGADTFVMGSAIFNPDNKNNYQEIISKCREILTSD